MKLFLGYDPQIRPIEVEFHSGSICEYYGMPDHVHEQIMQAPSKGSCLNSYIKIVTRIHGLGNLSTTTFGGH